MLDRSAAQFVVFFCDHPPQPPSPWLVTLHVPPCHSVESKDASISRTFVSRSRCPASHKRDRTDDNRLDGIEEDAIRDVNIPTGEPFVYEFDANLRPVREPDELGFRGRFVGGKSRHQSHAETQAKACE